MMLVKCYLLDGLIIDLYYWAWWLPIKCPNCNSPMDFVGRYILDVSVESAAPSHLQDFEVWQCEKCAKTYVDPGDGRPHEVEGMPRGVLY